MIVCKAGVQTQLHINRNISGIFILFSHVNSLVVWQGFSITPSKKMIALRTTALPLLKRQLSFSNPIILDIQRAGGCVAGLPQLWLVKETPFSTLKQLQGSIKDGPSLSYGSVYVLHS